LSNSRLFGVLSKKLKELYAVNKQENPSDALLSLLMVSFCTASLAKQAFYFRRNVEMLSGIAAEWQDVARMPF
jgi:hypothetical protein